MSSKCSAKLLASLYRNSAAQIQPDRDALLTHDVIELGKERADLLLRVVKAVFERIVRRQDQSVSAILPGRVEHLQRCLHAVRTIVHHWQDVAVNIDHGSAPFLKVHRHAGGLFFAQLRQLRIDDTINALTKIEDAGAVRGDHTCLVGMVLHDVAQYRRSVSTSSALVASSSNKIGASRRMARAIAMRWV